MESYSEKYRLRIKFLLAQPTIKTKKITCTVLYIYILKLYNLAMVKVNEAAQPQPNISSGDLRSLIDLVQVLTERRRLLEIIYQASQDQLLDTEFCKTRGINYTMLLVAALKDPKKPGGVKFLSFSVAADPSTREIIVASNGKLYLDTQRDQENDTDTFIVRESGTKYELRWGERNITNGMETSYKPSTLIITDSNGTTQEVEFIGVDQDTLNNGTALDDLIRITKGQIDLPNLEI